jgi:hypothetical protein
MKTESVRAGRSEITVKQFRETKDETNFKIYINGVGRGFLWANVFLDRAGKPLLYCQPPKLALGSDNYIQLLTNYIDDNKHEVKDDAVVEALLLLALQEAFPCR